MDGTRRDFLKAGLSGAVTVSTDGAGKLLLNIGKSALASPHGILDVAHLLDDTNQATSQLGDEWLQAKRFPIQGESGDLLDRSFAHGAQALVAAGYVEELFHNNPAIKAYFHDFMDSQRRRLGVIENHLAHDKTTYHPEGEKTLSRIKTLRSNEGKFTPREFALEVSSIYQNSSSAALETKLEPWSKEYDSRRQKFFAVLGSHFG